MTVKIFGLQRSGTNLSENVLSELGLEVIDSGFNRKGICKHGPPKECADKHVCLVKDPYAWVISELNFNHWRRQNILDWAKRTRQFLKKQEEDPSRWIVVKYHDLISGRTSELESFLGLKAGSFFLPKKKLGFSSDFTVNDFDISYYTEHKYLRYLTEQNKKSISINSKGLRDFIEKKPEGKSALEISSKFTGFGDCVCGSIIAHSISKHTGREVIFYNTNHEFTKEIIGLNSRIIKKAPSNCLSISGKKSSSLDESHRGCKEMSRIEWLLGSLPKEYHDIPIVKPKPRTKTFTKCREEVLIFPNSRSPTRCYDYSSWEEVARKLEGKGVSPIFVFELDDQPPESLCEKYRHYFCPSMSVAISMINENSLIIGVDSGPMHVAGLLGKKGLSLLASMSHESIYSYYPTVESISGEGECAKCHFQRDWGFQESCKISCKVLNSIDPSLVAKKALEILEVA